MTIRMSSFMLPLLLIILSSLFVVDAQFELTQPPTGPNIVCAGSNVTIQCIISRGGGSQATSWRRNGIVLNSAEFPNHLIVFNDTIGTFSDLVITNVPLEDDGTEYQCTDTGQPVNIESPLFVLNVTGPPFPSDIIPTDVCFRNATISWDPFSNHEACGIVSYLVTISPLHGSKMKIDETTYMFTNLAIGTIYTVKVVGHNNAGEVESSGMLTTASRMNLGRVTDKCLEYIVIERSDFNSSFCGEGEIAYDVTISPGGRVITINQTHYNLTELQLSTQYTITIVVIRGGNVIYNFLFTNSTLESLVPPPVEDGKFTINPEVVVNEGDVITVTIQPPFLYFCVPNITHYVVTIIINGSNPVSRNVPSNITTFSMSDIFTDHPMPGLHYTANVVVVNDEGQSPPTGSVPLPPDDDDEDDGGTTTIIIIIVVIIVVVIVVVGIGSPVSVYIYRKKKQAAVQGNDAPDSQSLPLKNTNKPPRSAAEEQSLYSYARTGPINVVMEGRSSVHPGGDKPRQT